MSKKKFHGYGIHSKVFLTLFCFGWVYFSLFKSMFVCLLSNAPLKYNKQQGQMSTLKYESMPIKPKINLKHILVVTASAHFRSLCSAICLLAIFTITKATTTFLLHKFFITHHNDNFFQLYQTSKCLFFQTKKKCINIQFKTNTYHSSLTFLI